MEGASVTPVPALHSPQPWASEKARSGAAGGPAIGCRSNTDPVWLRGIGGYGRTISITNVVVKLLPSPETWP